MMIIGYFNIYGIEVTKSCITTYSQAMGSVHPSNPSVPSSFYFMYMCINIQCLYSFIQMCIALSLETPMSCRNTGAAIGLKAHKQCSL